MDNFKLKISPDQVLTEKKLADLKADLKNKSGKELKQAAEDFEAIFVYYLLRTMRKTVMKSGLVESGLGGSIMESMFDQEISKKIAAGSQFGIAEILVRQLADKISPNSRALQNSEPVPLSGKKATAATRKYFRNSVEQKLAPFEPHIKDAARRYKIDSDLIKAVILAESSGNPQAVSAKGAKGLMQLMDGTARELGVSDPFDPRENIFAGTAYLADLLKKFNGDVKLALSGYNAGPDSVKKHAGIPPYRETRQYVRKILNYLRLLKADF